MNATKTKIDLLDMMRGSSNDPLARLAEEFLDLPGGYALTMADQLNALMNYRRLYNLEVRVARRMSATHADVVFEGDGTVPVLLCSEERTLPKGTREALASIRITRFQRLVRRIRRTLA